VWRLGTRVLAILATVALIIVEIVPPRVAVASPKSVLIADLEEGETLLSPQAAWTALSTGLQQSPSINVFAPNDLQEALHSMKRSPRERITTQLGREICVREGIGPLITWNLVQSTNTYLLQAQALNPSDGTVLAEVKTAPFHSTSVTKAIGDLASNLRRQFGDSALKVYSSSKPLEIATTPYLPALEYYAAAEQHLAEKQYAVAETELQKALDIDSDFAMALREMATLYDYRGEVVPAIASITRAYQLRDDVTKPEQVKIDDLYFNFVLSDPKRALKEVSDFVSENPKNTQLLSTLADDSSELMRFDIAEDAELRLRARRPFSRASAESVLALWNDQIRLNQFPSAVETAKQAQRDIPDLLEGPYIDVLSSLAVENIAQAENEISRLQQTHDELASLWLGGLLDIYKGRLSSAQTKWSTYINSIEHQQPMETWVPGKDVAQLWLARICLVSGNTAEARSHLGQVQSVRNEFLAEVGKYYARLGDLEQAERILAYLKGRLAGRITNQNQATVNLVESEIELKRGNSQRSFDLISSAAQYPWLYLYLPVEDSLANAALASGHYDTAAAAYKEIVDKRGFAFSFDRPDDWIMARFGLGRANDLMDKKEMAPLYYTQFEHLWHDGDDSLPPLRFARERIAELTQFPPSHIGSKTKIDHN
jgi:tetratricopeptide (TPR) repeat protein